jgi:hypothetical protein
MSFEDRQPIPQAEVCVFGADTLCVATDQKGEYLAQARSSVLLEGGRLTVRFRGQGFPTAVAELVDVAPGGTRVDCGVSNRVTLSARPVACLPIEP